MKVTIITPTYNRGKKLQELYKSLIKQTNKEFMWLIIDDGSNDNTEKIVKELINQNMLRIEYYKKQNGGKHTALNMGIRKIQTDLTFIVDSDDWLEQNAIERICAYHEKYENNTKICGYSFLRKYSNGNINGKMFKENEMIEDYVSARINRHDTHSDKAEVWKTKCLKEYPFPEFKDEKFLGEDVIWIQLAMKYKMVFINEAIYVSEYLEDGLTQNRRKNNIQSPNGCYYRAKVALEVSKYIKMDFQYLIKCILQYQVYGKFIGKRLKDYYTENNFKILTVLTYPLSCIIYKMWKNKN